MAPSTHQAKRPYAGTHSQATITSFFPRSVHSHQNANSQSHHAPALSPTLPASVQSNLLSVGMRVRKSVPEGYKTGGYSAFTLFSDATNHVSGVSKPLPKTSYVRKELTPFCGILKTGGLAQQQPSIDDFAVPDEDDVPFLSSQGSTISGVSTYSNGNGYKRRFDEEEEAEEDDVIISRAAQEFCREEEISPRSMMPVDPFRRSSGLAERALAVPKSRRKIVNLGGMGKMVGVVDGQENALDFGEADFLDYEGLREFDMMDG